MTLSECQALLTEARAAHHSLMTGTRARVIVDQNGQRVEFANSNRADLASYILQLESQCGCAVGAVPMGVGGPCGFTF